MKKIILLLLCLIPIKVNAISASSYIVMDMDSERILEGKNIDDSRLIASISKIMTCIVALEYGNINEEIIVDDVVKESFGSGIYIKIGEKISIRDLLYGLMLRSGNDAALQIAKSTTGSVDSFVFLMNSMAKKVGMNNTKFINPTGLENNKGEGNKSSAKDMALLMIYAMKNERFREIVSTKEYKLTTNKNSYKWINKNKLLRNYEYCNGGKTGFTKKAKRTLVTTASKNNMNIVIVTLNDGNDFEDHKYLYEKYFNNYHIENILNKDEIYDDKYINKDLNMIVSKDEKVEIKNTGKDLRVMVDNELVKTIRLYYRDSLVSRIISFWEKL